MANPMIEINNISKRYRIGETLSYGSLRDEIMQTITAPFRRGKKPSAEEASIWALKDVSLNVKEGEVLGVIGRNGSGKSTLLKILSRITEPTSGRIRLRGRVASLLEVGTGFHPELTGRENILLNGALLGMTHREIRSKFDEIVAFAEVDKFLDTPVKRYSSGMYVRLAFAVAAHLEPEILLIDEVLSVGDAAFQKKCLGKMGDVATGGRTVLFVSHNMLAVKTLCHRVVHLDSGSVVREGGSEEVVSSYLAAPSEIIPERVWDKLSDAPGDEIVRLRAIRIRNEDGEMSPVCAIDKSFSIEIECWSLKDVEYDVSISILNREGIVVFATRSSLSGASSTDRGLKRFSCEIPKNLLNTGCYTVILNLLGSGMISSLRMKDAFEFEVMDNPELRGGHHGEWMGIVRPHLKWNVERLSDDIST